MVHASVRPRVDLDPYKEEIIRLHQSGSDLRSILQSLSLHHNINIHERTLHNRLRDWGIRRNQRPISPNRLEDLENHIQLLFFENGLEDKDMLKVLQAEGFDIAMKTLKRHRLKLGIVRRPTDLTPETKEAADRIIQKLLEAEMKKKVIDGYGRRLLYQHMRQQGNIIARQAFFTDLALALPNFAFFSQRPALCSIPHLSPRGCGSTETTHG